MGSTVPLGIGPTRTCASNSRRVKCSVAAIASVRDILSSKDGMGTKYYATPRDAFVKVFVLHLLVRATFPKC